MQKEQRRFEEKHFVEDVGLYFEQAGHPRMAGRIIGALLIADPPHLSMTELCEMLGASKGSLSTMTRLLLQMGLIERVAVPGGRRDYFQLKSGAWTQLVQQETYEFTALRQLADRGLELMDEQDSEIKQRLEDARGLFAFLEQEYPRLIERWERERPGVAKKKTK